MKFRLVFLLLLFFSAAGYTESIVLFESGIETGPVGDGQYVTQGAVLLDAEPFAVRKLMSDVPNFDSWLLSGMGEQAARNARLKVSLNDIRVNSGTPSSCLVGFSLFLTRRWILHDKHMNVHVAAYPEQPGWINRIKYSLPFSGSLAKGGNYVVFIFPLGLGQSLVVYRFNIQLAGLARLLFSERLYSRNIEWYIRKTLMNCAEFLSEN